MSVKMEGILVDIKTTVFHHSVKAKNLNFNNYIYILYYKSSTRFLFSHIVANFQLSV